MRPILGIGGTIARAVCAGRPCCPPEEGGHLALFDWVFECSRRNRVLVAAISVNVSVVACQVFKGFGPLALEHNRARRRVVGISSRQFRQASSKGCPRFS